MLEHIFRKFLTIKSRHVKLNVTTFFVVSIVVVSIGILGVEYLVDYVEKMYIQLQVDVNKRQGQNILRIVNTQLRLGISMEEVAKSFQGMVSGTQTDRGYMCMIDRNRGVLLCHPDSAQIGHKTGLKPNFLPVEALESTPTTPAAINRSLSSEGRGGVLMSGDTVSQIIYFQPVEHTTWVIAIHENARRIRQELTQLRAELFLWFAILGVCIIVFSTLAARYIGRKYEVDIEEKNNLLTNQAIEISAINEDLKVQNEQFALLNQEKTEIMGIVAHDLRNPIGAVRSMAELIQSEAFSGQNLSDAANKIITTSGRMLALVSNVLDINRLDEGAIHFMSVEFDMLPQIEAICEQYQYHAASKSITLHLQTSDSSAIVTADEQALLQVLDNIVSNAVKYSPHGKSVFVRVKSGVEAVRLEVQDEGPGISEDDMKKLFGKFARLSARPTGDEHSTGLGLSIVKKMVEAMNGRVWCESELGQGATFIVELSKG